MSKLILDGRELWQNLRFWYDASRNHPMINGFSPLDGSIIGFSKNIDGKEVFVSLKTAIENLEFDEKNPKSLSYLIYGQFIWSDRSPISVYDLEMGLWFDEKCTKFPVTFVTFKFPQKPIQNGAFFAVKVTLIKNVEFLAWNMLQQPLLELEKAALPITQNPQWESWFKQQPKQVQEAFTKTRQFSIKICGRAVEMR
jgi:hypothetical protein